MPSGLAPGASLGYLFVVTLWSVVGFVYVVVMFALTAGLLVTVVGGGGILGAMIVGARGFGAADRGLARGMLRAEINNPRPFRRKKGLWAGIWSMVCDGVGWRAVAFMVLQLPLAIATLVIAVVWLAVPLGAMTHWYWSRFLPAVPDTRGVLHRGAELLPDYFVDTTPRQVVMAVAGLLLFFVGAAIVRGLAHLHRMLAEGLLGPTEASMRVASLEQSRGRAVEDADSTLRRIERNLHDGTQARLVAIAMQLGEAKEQASASGASRELTDLIAAAHVSTKETLVEPPRAVPRDPPTGPRQRSRCRPRDPGGAQPAARPARRRPPGPAGVTACRGDRDHRVLLRDRAAHQRDQARPGHGAARPGRRPGPGAAPGDP